MGFGETSMFEGQQPLESSARDSVLFRWDLMVVHFLFDW